MHAGAVLRSSSGSSGPVLFSLPKRKPVLILEGMSDHIAHLGICDDTFRLAAFHPDLPALFKEVMVGQRDIAHMGSVTRTADLWSIDVILRLRDSIPADGSAGKSDDPRALQKLAYVLGALTHRSADRHMKPITTCWGKGEDSGEAGGDANESKILQDLFVFKEVYNSGCGEHADPFTSATLATPGTEGEAAFEEQFRVLLRRALIAMHTIAPDHDDIHTWLDQFLKRLQTFPKSLDQYARLAAEWDQGKIKKYLIDKNFYRRGDPLIRLAREIQRGSTVNTDEVLATIASTDKSCSRYARALAKAVDYLVAAAALFEGRLEAASAKTRLDIGVPELSLQD